MVFGVQMKSSEEEEVVNSVNYGSLLELNSLNSRNIVHPEQRHVNT